MKSDTSHRYAVILAGGRGTRLWPISTQEQPKQFQALGDTRPLIAQTFDRLKECVGAGHIFVSTTAEYADDVLASLPELNPAHLVVEPRPEGKPAAFLLIAHRIAAVDPAAVVLSAASDSSIVPLEAFQAAAERSFDFVEAHPSWTTLLAIAPTHADTSLGYVRATGHAMGVPGIRVARDFLEKPSHAVAEEFLAAHDYFWNTSHYCFSVATLTEAYEQASPELGAAITAYVSSGDAADYRGDPGPDHELLPFVDCGWPIGVVESDFRWYDIGTWPSLYRALADSKGTDLVTSGSHVDLDSSSGLVVNDSAMTVVTAGIEGLAVIVSDAVVLVAPIATLEDHPQTIAHLQQRCAGVAGPEREIQ